MAADLTNNDPRFRSLNVLSFDLDMPERTTADYEQDVNPNVRAALTAALKDDEEIAVEAEENLPSMGMPGVGGNGWTPDGGVAPRGGSNDDARPRRSTLEKPRRRKASKKLDDDDDLDALLGGGTSSRQQKQPPPEEQFPSSRGLIGGQRRPGSARMR